ncbi:MAG TPA: hypothetical protein VGC09_14125 [Rhodopila sp.]
MKQLILATIAVVGLSMGSALAQSFSHGAPPNSDQHRVVGSND